jgi:septal ring factor EnvC (AmiA/AmiB activator)
MRIFFYALIVAFLSGILPCSQMAQASKIGENMKQLEADKAKKEKELKNLEKLEEIVDNEIGTAKAEMAQNMNNTVQKVGHSKANPDGLVTTSGGIVHSPSKHWKLNVNNLRKEYENAGIYTPDEIDVIVEFHKSYVANQGFTAGIAEQLAKVAEATAQKRTIQKYIARKKQEIDELENAIRGTSSGDGGGGGGSGGGGSGGY